MRRILLLLVSATLALSLSPAGADPWPDDPYSFCMPDLDGHCRYCEAWLNDPKHPRIYCVS